MCKKNDPEVVIKQFFEGWKHFLDCVNFETSAFDATAISFMNELPKNLAAIFVPDRPNVEKNFCVWTCDYKEETYHTSCNQHLDFISGTYEEHSFVYCPFCGQKITNNIS